MPGLRWATGGPASLPSLWMGEGDTKSWVVLDPLLFWNSARGAGGRLNGDPRSLMGG